MTAERPADVAALPCPTCSFPSRETVDMVCRTCLTDYAPGPRRWAEGYEAGRAEVTAAVEALADEWWPADIPGMGTSDCAEELARAWPWPKERDGQR